MTEIEWAELIFNAAGLAATIAWICNMKSFMHHAVRDMKMPLNMAEGHWTQIKYFEGDAKDDGKSSAVWIGRLEAAISFAAYLLGKYELVGGWLAFKLATKWEVWKNIVQVPAQLTNARGDADIIDPMSWFQARKEISSWILSRFLIGTAANVLAGGAAGYFFSALRAMVFATK